jgi:hypothetical protein
MRRVVLLCAAVGAIACASESSTAPAARGVFGDYALLSINGLPTPLLLGQNDTAKLELVESKMTLGADASFSEIFSLRWTVPSGIRMEVDTARGSFITSGTTLTFQPSDGSGTYQMTVTDEHTLTENDPGYLMIYHRP